ncbi:MAG: hypothetical protein ACXVW0_05880 [Nocardioides sp.]
MPLGKGIVGMLAAVQERIEVTGQAPTWRVTGASFDQALAYARAAWGDPVVLARESGGWWWPRVTLTVTTDPQAAATAPSLEELAADDRLLPRQRGTEQVLVVPDAPDRPAPAPASSASGAAFGTLVSLDEIFEHQEARRMARAGSVPQQRSGTGAGS